MWQLYVFYSFFFFNEQNKITVNWKDVYSIIKCLEGLTHVSWGGHMSYEKKESLLLEWHGSN